MNIKISKSEASEQIEKFFRDIKTKSSKEIKKIKRLAANKKIPLKEKKKLFCRKCLNPYSGNEKIRIKNNMKSTKCLECGFISRWRVK